MRNGGRDAEGIRLKANAGYSIACATLGISLPRLLR